MAIETYIAQNNVHPFMCHYGYFHRPRHKILTPSYNDILSLYLNTKSFYVRCTVMHDFWRTLCKNRYAPVSYIELKGTYLLRTLTSCLWWMHAWIRKSKKETVNPVKNNNNNKNYIYTITVTFNQGHTFSSTLQFIPRQCVTDLSLIGF